MDIVNWLYLKANKLIKSSIQQNDDIILLGTDVSFEKRGDQFKSYGISYSQFVASLPPASSGLFAQIADGPVVTNTTTESTLVGTGVGSLSVPANSFQVGDSFSVTIGGHISAKNNNTLRIRVRRNGTTILGDTGIIIMPGITDKRWEMEITFTIRAIGPAGVASITSAGQFTYSKNASNAFEGSDFSVVNNTTFDTTILNTLNITAEWGQADPLDSIYTEHLVLTKIY